MPSDRGELRGGLRGVVALPARLFWSGPNPRAVRWDLADSDRRRDLYEIALVEGTLEDIRELVNGAKFVRLWDRERRNSLTSGWMVRLRTGIR